MGKALADVRRQKTSKLLWALGTALFTVVSTTATVSWKMGTYIARAEAKDDKLRGDLIVIAKKLEDLDLREVGTEKELRAAIYDVKVSADKALLYAELRRNGVAKP